MEQSPSWEANKSSATQEIPRILCNPEVFITAFTRAHHPSLSWARSIQSISSSHFFKIRFNITQPSKIADTMIKYELIFEMAIEFVLCAVRMTPEKQLTIWTSRPLRDNYMKHQIYCSQEASRHLYPVRNEETCAPRAVKVLSLTLTAVCQSLVLLENWSLRFESLTGYERRSLCAVYFYSV
jgi:hypothetical protein